MHVQEEDQRPERDDADMPVVAPPPGALRARAPRPAEPADDVVPTDNRATTGHLADLPAVPSEEDREPGTDKPADQTEQPAPTDPEAWYASLSEEQRGVVDAWANTRIATIQGALLAERDRTKSFEKQVRTLARTAEEGSAIKQQLDEMATNMKQQEQQIEFYEEALQSGIRRNALRLAYLAAIDGGFIDGRGAINWDDLRAAHGETLFEPQQRRKIEAHLGEGSGGEPAQIQRPRTPSETMNERLRSVRRSG